MAYRAIVNYEQGDMDTALDCAHYLLQFVRERSEVRWAMAATNILGMVLLAKEHPKEALNCFNEVINVGLNLRDQYREELIDALFGRCLCHYDRRDALQFRRDYEIFSNLRSGDCNCYYAMRGMILSGLLYLSEGRATQAAVAFQSVSNYRLMSPFYNLVARLGLAECASYNRDMRSAEEYLGEIDHLLVHSKGALLAWKDRFPSAINTAQQLNFDWPVVPSPNPYMGNTSTVKMNSADAALQLRVLGESSLRVFGAPVDPAQWHRSDRNKELLTFLALHPQGVSREQIKLHMWPGLPSWDALHQQFHALRQMLGHEGLIVFDHGRYRLGESSWCDVAAYEKIYTEARHLPLLQRTRLYKQAATIYRGEFLEGIEGNVWVDEQRMRLANMQAWLFWAVGAIYYESNLVQESLHFLDQSLAVNPIFDLAIEHKMRLLERMNCRSEAVAIFEVYRRRIEQHLGIAPSPRLQELLDRWAEEPMEIVTGPFENQQQWLRGSALPVKVYDTQPKLMIGNLN